MPCSAAGAGTGDAGRKVAYLSDEWIEALDAALGHAPAGPAEAQAQAEAEAEAEAGVDRVIVQYRVEGGPDGSRSWHLDLAPDRLRARAGDALAALSGATDMPTDMPTDVVTDMPTEVVTGAEGAEEG